MSRQPIPNVNRGVLILLAPDATDPAISVKNIYFMFQYNPEKLLHILNPTEQLTFAKEAEAKFPPAEFFNLTFELDSLDVEADAPLKKQVTPDFGVHPALAMLEQMMQIQQGKGNQTSNPVVVFKWGQKRLLPVYLVSMSVEEKTFDSTLNPTRASVSLILRVLTAAEISSNQAARKVFEGHQKDQSMLVEVYKSLTGQAPDIKPGAAMGAAVESKTKIRA